MAHEQRAGSGTTGEQYDRNAAVMVIDRFRRSASNPAVAVFGGATNTYGEFGDKVSLAAAALHEAGVARGDRVAFAAGNAPEIVEYLVATLALGAVFVPLNTRLSAAELQFIVTDAQCTVTVADSDLARHLAPVQDALGTALVGCGAGDLPAGWTPDRNLVPGPVPQLDQAVDTEPGDLAILMYTSGTARNPLHPRRRSPPMTSAVPSTVPPAVPIHPFVALMKRYAIDYTNSHDQTIYPELFVDEYTVNIGGVALVRDESYGPAVRWLYDRAPGLGLVVHELVLNGDRLCMRFSEHASMPVPGGGRALSCWRGIGMYAWDGERLVSNWVEQDFLSRRRQVETGHPDALEPPHLDPWVTTVPTPPDAEAEAVARAAVVDDRLHEAAVAHIDDAVGHAGPLVVEPHDVTFNDCFSAGRRVAVHATVGGPYRGGVFGVPDQAIGGEVSLQVVALVDVAADGTVGEVRAVTDREGVRAQLRAAD